MAIDNYLNPFTPETPKLDFSNFVASRIAVLEAQKCVTDIWPAFYHFNDIFFLSHRLRVPFPTEKPIAHRTKVLPTYPRAINFTRLNKGQPLEFVTNCLLSVAQRSHFMNIAEQLTSSVWRTSMGKRKFLCRRKRFNWNFLRLHVHKWIWLHHQHPREHSHHLFMVLRAIWDYNTIFYSLIFLSILAKGLAPTPTR